MGKMAARPLQVYLSPDQVRALEEWAKRSGQSKAAIIRESLERYLTDLPIEEDPAMAIVSLGDSGRGDLAEDHDAVVEEAVRSKRRDG